MDQTITSVNSLSEYLAATETICSKISHELIPRRIYYRGHSSEGYQLIPSLARMLKGYYNLEFGFERRIVEYVEEHFPEAFANIKTPLDKLAFLQHHGAPTRLLDVTSSSLVALFFAVSDSLKDDGEVFVFAPVDRESERYPMDMAIADSYRMIRGSIDYLEHFYDRVKVQDYFQEQRDLVDNYVDETKGGGRWVMECCVDPMFVHSFHHSARQKAQQSSFILFPNDINKEDESHPHFVENISSLSKDSEVIVGRIIVPASSKEAIATELEHAGVSRSVLFADSIDVICEEAGRFAVEHAC